MAINSAKKIDSAALEAIELDPAAWPKFESLVKSAAKTPPSRDPKASAKPATAKKRKPSA